MTLTLLIFLAFVGFTLGLSFYLGSRAKSSTGYFAAHGQVGWFVNGIAFAGDYLSAASFLGICGLIAFYGYDGFLYSIGFLAGWIVALLVIAEPIKKLGKFTFADALRSRFVSGDESRGGRGGARGITLAVAVSTLIVSTFYLIPQMVGAGSLIRALLGWEFHWGVISVGTAVIVIVATAGMVSTTWVQFLKGSLLVVFCAGLVIAVLAAGVKATPGVATLPVNEKGQLVWTGTGRPPGGAVYSAPAGADAPLGPAAYIAAVSQSQVVKWTPTDAKNPGAGWTGTITPGEKLLLPGGYFKGIRSEHVKDRLDFVSLMLALFAGTASLPHILIRYYTVKDAAAARKSTVVGIGAIGFFYCLTLFIGLGAMTSGAIDATDSNQAAPLLAKRFGDLPFALISAIAFTTVLGTVAGLILAGSGAIAHDVIENVLHIRQSERQKVLTAKISAVFIGVVAMGLGIVFQNLNASFLVGWAFNIAASANLPAIVMLLFWKGTTRQGVMASVLVGLFSSLGWLLLSAPAFEFVYRYPHAEAVKAAIVPFSQPALVTLPLAFAVLVGVSLVTQPRRH